MYVVNRCFFRSVAKKGAVINHGEELKGKDLAHYEKRLPYFVKEGLLVEHKVEAVVEKKAEKKAKKGKAKKAETLDI